MVSIDGFTPCSPAESVSRAQSLLVHPTNATTGYRLGTGGYHPGAVDLPWTTDEHGVFGSDCAGLTCWAYRLARHRPGYNRGNPCGVANYDVEDDLNSNSFLGDAARGGRHELFMMPSMGPGQVGDPLPGDVLAYPTFRLPGHRNPSEMLTFIGHVALVVRVDRWDGSLWGSLDIVQVCGPEGRRPAAIASTGAHFDAHNATWPKPEHRAWLLRPVS
jgi:hypothetical protein